MNRKTMYPPLTTLVVTFLLSLVFCQTSWSNEKIYWEFCYAPDSESGTSLENNKERKEMKDLIIVCEPDLALNLREPIQEKGVMTINAKGADNAVIQLLNLAMERIRVMQNKAQIPARDGGQTTESLDVCEITVEKEFSSQCTFSIDLIKIKDCMRFSLCVEYDVASVGESATHLTHRFASTLNIQDLIKNLDAVLASAVQN